MKETTSQLWEVLVSANDNEGNEFPVEHHHVWDEGVRDITGGLTIMRTAKGQWLDAEGNLFAEKVIPVRVACGEAEIRQIMELTIQHYGQLAVMASQISERVIILEADS
ncbi:MAG TPA: hypothetical protein VK694_05340 [Verrucomicrobiae bacterium]|nr:hypothetical protein [Verrucomicrobiae bacterium]